jgi:hypothetical protein
MAFSHSEYCYSGERIRMASTSIDVQPTYKKNLLVEMLTAVHDSLSPEDRQKLEQWFPQIEEYAEKIITGLDRTVISRRRPEILHAAAIYDAFLEHESRTNVAVRLPLLEDVFGVALCSINSAWTRLFDNRALLRKDHIVPVYGTRDTTFGSAILAIITNIRHAVLEMTPEVQKWIEQIYRQSLETVESIDMPKIIEYDTVLIATAVIYAAIRKYAGKPRIQISQRDLAQFCCHSPSMLSKVWLELVS